jgi:uncharacterized protein (DUF1697 family)
MSVKRDSTTRAASYVALLRGVNIGKANRVPMAEFRGLLEGLNFAAVRTLLNSGNAIFSAPRRASAQYAKAIHTALHSALGLELPVVVKSSREFLAAVEQIPFEPAEDEHSRLLVAFAQQRAALQGLSMLNPLVRSDERFHIGRQAAYLLCTGGILESKAAAAMLGKVGRSVTTRNWATVLKLRQLLDIQPRG